MAGLRVVLVTMLLVACERSAPPSKPPPAPAPVATIDARDELGDAVAAFIADYVPYLDRVLQIMRDARGDCEVAAKGLEGLTDTFQRIGTRGMEIKQRMQTVDAAARERLERRMDGVIEEFRAKHPDAEALVKTAGDCSRTSAAFAAVSDRVMFVRKRR